MSAPDEFDGQRETFRMEHGATYGLSKITYWRLASCAMGAKQYGGIEPCEIARLADSPGCRVLLYGKAFCFFVEVQADCHPNIVGLSALRLDDVSEQPFELIEAAPDDDDAWRRLLSIMLALDGYSADWQALSYDEATELMRRQGLI
jgi:hypothetical protein